MKTLAAALGVTLLAITLTMPPVEAAEPATKLRADTQASLAPLHLATAQRAAAVSRQLAMTARRGLATRQAEALADLPLALDLKLASARP